MGVRFSHPQPIYWELAQLVERLALNQQVRGSKPLFPAIGAYSKLKRIIIFHSKKNLNGSSPLKVMCRDIWVSRLVAMAVDCKSTGFTYVGSSPTWPTIQKMIKKFFGTRFDEPNNFVLVLSLQTASLVSS